MVNLSLQTGCFPDIWKIAILKPLLKKRDLDPVFGNLRPISNLSSISKLTERAVVDQVQCYLTTNSLYPLLQSAYRKYHSTETALLKVKNDLLMNMNKGHMSILVLLDMSSAFDTVDHEILIQRLETKFGFKGTVLAWFSSYLNGRQQRVLVNDSLSDIFEFNCGVPQGSCLGPLLFTLCANEIFDIIERHLSDIHAYADDSQLYISCNPNSVNDQEAAILAM